MPEKLPSFGTEVGGLLPARPSHPTGASLANAAAEAGNQSLAAKSGETGRHHREDGQLWSRHWAYQAC